MYIARDEVLLTLDVEFDPDLPAARVAEAAAHIARTIRERYPMITQTSVQPRLCTAAAA